MEGRSPEFAQVKKPETMDKGFSEKRAARILEGKRMDNSQIKKRKPLSSASRQKIVKIMSRRKLLSQREKIIVAHDKNAKALLTLIKTLGFLASGSIRQEERLMVEIRARQKIQEQLLDALVQEAKGELSEESLPKELSDLIK